MSLALYATASAESTSVTPVQKVLQLMEGMLAKAKDEKHAEQVQFAEYKQFCDDTGVEKKRAISDAEETISVLTADIEKYTAHAEKLTKEIAAHDEDISVWNGDKAAATTVREMENTDYVATHKDYSESIDALGRAIAVLKKQAHDRPQALLEVASLRDLHLIPEDAKGAITAFLDSDQPVGAPEASGYEFQSHGVIEMLEQLLDKFTAERTKLEKEEMNSKQAFEMLIQDLTAQVNQATSERNSKSQTKAKKLEAKATAEGDLEDTTNTMNADKKYLSDLVATCSEKSGAFEQRQTLRGEEIEAINKAMEIIQSGAVSGAADKHLPALAQMQSALVQMRAETKESSTQARLVQFLQSRAKQ